MHQPSSIDAQHAATVASGPHPGVTLGPGPVAVTGLLPEPPPAQAARYTPETQLGYGGMGVVERAQDRALERAVAIKTLHADLNRDAASVARFVDEIRTVGSLDHPNIVPIHDVGVRPDGRLFFVMKLIDGETLESIIRRLQTGDCEAHATYPPRRRLEIFFSVLRALSFAHQRGFVHRDIKPSNVMVGGFGEVVLMDWGIAKPIDSEHDARQTTQGAKDGLDTSSRAAQTAADSMIGTPLYMSPEQTLTQGIVDARSDLYSASLMLHQMLTLKHRFEDYVEVDPLVRAIRKTDPPKPRRMFREIPTQSEPIPYELSHYLRRGMARDPDQRWQTADEMMRELQAILDGRCRIQCPTTFVKRLATGMVELVDRRPGLVMLLLLGLLLAFVATFFI